MRRLMVKREKCKLCAIWADYWCVLDFDTDNFPPLCKKEIDCQDCDEYCEQISSNKEQLFIESSDEIGNRKLIEPIRAVRIKNGKTVEIEIDDQEHEMFILFAAGRSRIVSNKITIHAGCSDVSYSIKTTGGIVKSLNITVG